MADFAGRTALKGGVIFALFWGAWFEIAKNQWERRTTLLCGFLGAAASLAVARAIALIAPFRERPLVGLAQFRIPYVTSSENIIHWSSFPSDHAALYFGVSVGILLASRRLGIISLLYSLLFISIPRMYVGLHYPSDILAGALIGTIAVLLVALAPLVRNTVQRLLRYELHNPSVFYMILFFVTAQLVDMFLELRMMAAFVLHAIKGLG
ncbi:MAG TPA: phosphatase PAP2 family protein [Candidatus Angelobacter sp.]|nr:phosphatase PAP2 family protein [Candidatus Angelobacter sp.]